MTRIWNLVPNYLSPNKVFLLFVEPLVLKEAFLFLPLVDFLCERMYSVLLVLDAIWSSIFSAVWPVIIKQF